ncbi:MAG: dihydroorotate dehydrogenase electron transfer subunit [bacterium]
MSELLVKKTEKLLLIANVINNLKLDDNIYQITLNCREVAENALPGQFISVLCKDKVLRRPFSIAYTDQDNFEIIYKIKGEGTNYISSLKSGDNLDIIGPLGNGFNILDKNKKALLVGGGVGVAPLIFLSKILEEKQISYVLLAGFQKLLNIQNFPHSKSFIVTEDESSGFAGRINDYLEDVINTHKPEKIYACGPKPVLKFVTEMAIQHDIEIEVALERDFACGIGVCMGCTIQIKKNNKLVNKRICKDGPVFDGRSIIW